MWEMKEIRELKEGSDDVVRAVLRLAVTDRLR